MDQQLTVVTTSNPETTPVVKVAVTTLALNEEELNTAITDATILQTAQVTRVEAVSTNDQTTLAGAWEVYNAAVTAYGTAITTATGLREWTNANQTDVDNAVTALTTATTTFNIAKDNV